VFCVVVKQVTVLEKKKILLKYQERNDNVSGQWILMNPAIFGGHLQRVKTLLSDFKDALHSVFLNLRSSRLNRSAQYVPNFPFTHVCLQHWSMMNIRVATIPLDQCDCCCCDWQNRCYNIAAVFLDRHCMHLLQLGSLNQSSALQAAVKSYTRDKHFGFLFSNDSFMFTREEWRHLMQNTLTL
jgi:hypothetical protein